MSILYQFIHALGNHDSNWQGHPLTTFGSQANYLGMVNRFNLGEIWERIQFAGRTRVMAGWQTIKQLHFQKYSAMVTYHPVYGWQASPNMPSLRVLLILDGEAIDMDELALDLLGLPWAYMTILLIGVEGCLKHHRHANKLQQISEANPRFSFVDVQGIVPERYALHELLKRHLGREITMGEFKELERLPAELPSPQEFQHERNQSESSRREQFPVELPSLEETQIWQRTHQLQFRHAPAVFEMSAERDPVELPVDEWSASSNRLYRPPQYSRLPVEPPPPYLESASRG